MTEILEKTVLRLELTQGLNFQGRLYMQELKCNAKTERIIQDHQLFIKIDTPSKGMEIITCLHRLRLYNYIIFLGGLVNDSCFFPSKTGGISLRFYFIIAVENCRFQEISTDFIISAGSVIKILAMREMLICLEILFCEWFKINNEAYWSNEHF